MESQETIADPMELLNEVEPHITIVHPRASTQERSAETRERGMRVMRHFPLPAVTRVVGAILRRQGEVLLCLRTRDRTSYPGMWDIPGGHVEESETLADALIRELEEELGISARIGSPKPWTVRRIGATELSVFVIDQWDGEPRNCALDEHDEVRWVPVDQLARLSFAHPSFEQLLTRASMHASPDE